MKFIPLIWAALWRRPVDTLLVLISLTAAFSLFGLMVGLDATTRSIVASSRLDRLWVNPRFYSGAAPELPIGMREQISQFEGVTGIGASRWFSGYHGDPHDSVSILSMDEGMRIGWSEGSLSPAQWDQLFATPSGLFVSGLAAARWKLAPGDTFTVATGPGTRADGGESWVFNAAGVHRGRRSLRRGRPPRHRPFLLDRKRVRTLPFDERDHPAGPVAAAVALRNQWLTTNPSLRVAAETQEHYNQRWASRQSEYFVAIAYLAGVLMSIGAFFGGVNVLQAIVAARRRQVAMLRALGYQGLPIAVSVVLEILLLSAAGAVAGACLAWLLFDGREIVRFGTVYVLSVSGSLFALGLAWSLGLALTGSLLPAIRAARVTLVDGLRAS